MSLKILILLPILEIVTFILFGDLLGFFPVISLILTSILLGLYLLKTNISIEELKNLSIDPKDWVSKKLAAILLIIPGFITDIIGIILLFKFLRGLVWGYIPKNTKQKFYNNQKKESKDEIIEVDYKDLDEK
tara:strand:+ start:71 stop:466 length:396 start_codon:yes stop_codon:yes gene_type:complete